MSTGARGTRARRAGDRLPASYINFYVANRARGDAALRQAPGPGRDAHARAAVSDPQGGRRRDAGGAARRRQHPLHHPAGAASGRPSERASTSRMELCRAQPLESLYSTHPLRMTPIRPPQLEAAVHPLSRKYASKLLSALVCLGRRSPPPAATARTISAITAPRGWTWTPSPATYTSYIVTIDSITLTRNDGVRGRRGRDAGDRRSHASAQRRRAVELRLDSGRHVHVGDDYRGLHARGDAGAR